MSDRTDMPYFLDAIDIIEKERVRLINLINSADYKKNPSWQWMEGWLAKNNGEHCKNGFGGDCNICGKRERFFLALDFSFCDEYGCGMKICSKCLSKMTATLKQGVRETLERGDNND